MIINRINTGVFKVLLASTTACCAMGTIGAGLRANSGDDVFQKSEMSDSKFAKTCKKIPAPITALYACMAGISLVGLRDAKKQK